jgi:hypothetical protein
MTTANNPNNNLSPWKPGQSGNPSGRPRGTRDLAGYVLESTGGGKELVDALASIARGVMPNVPVQEGFRARKDQQVRPADQLKAIEMLLDRGCWQPAKVGHFRKGEIRGKWRCCWTPAAGGCNVCG